MVLSLEQKHLPDQTPVETPLFLTHLCLLIESQQFFNLGKSQSSGLADRQHTFQNLFDALTDSGWHFQRLSHNRIQQSLLISPHPRQLSTEKFIKDDPNRPHITFSGVIDALEHLWSHIVGCSHMRTKKLGPLLQFRHPEVSNFQSSVLDEYVCRFEVSMHDTLFDQFLIPIQDLSQILASQVLTDGSAFGISPEVTMAELHHDVDATLFLHDLEQFYDVFMVELSQDANLIVDDVCDGPALREPRRHFDLFNGEGRVLKHFSERTSSHNDVQFILSTCDRLAHLNQQIILSTIIRSHIPTQGYLFSYDDMCLNKYSQVS